MIGLMLKEVLYNLDQLVKAGKIRYIVLGLSNAHHGV